MLSGMHRAEYTVAINVADLCMIERGTWRDRNSAHAFLSARARTTGVNLTVRPGRNVTEFRFYSK